MGKPSAKPVIFLAFANSSADPLPNLAEECRRLTDVLEDAERAGVCELLVRPYATADQVIEAFNKEAGDARVVVFHYAGHADGFGLLLEGANGLPAVADAGGLAAFLSHQDSLQLVFLNGCSTAGQAQALLDAGVQVVIASGEAIDDQIAADFATHFYRYLAGLDLMQVAYAKALAAMQIMHGDETLHMYAARSAESASAGQWPWSLSERVAGAAQRRLTDAAAASLLPFEPETVLVPAGPFLMASEPGEGMPQYETPRHTVTLPPFRIGKYPVTNRQYAEFLKRVKTQEEPPRVGWFLRRPPEGKLDHPVVGVSWQDASAYCAWLSGETDCTYRLPSEAEWEKAARGEDGRRYPWGNEWAKNRANAGGADTMPVDAYPAGASPYGCLDMVGNVQEWTRTLWGSHAEAPEFTYPYDAKDGREVAKRDELPSQARLVQRGGSFESQPGELRCAARGQADAASKIAWRGFRVVREP